MKRRQKLWIVCAALAVVVALCALALMYRPERYNFLERASLEGVGTGLAYTSFSSSTALAPPVRERTTYQYRLEGSFESVTESARRELKETDNWVWSKGGDGLKLATAWNPVTEESVAIYDTSGLLKDFATGGVGKRRVQVTVIKPTSPLDRVLAWLHNR